MKQEYPKWLYRGDEAQIVADLAEHEALGEGWSETPGGEQPQPEPQPKKRGRKSNGPA